MSDRYPGGLIRKTPPTITPPVDGEGGSASGIWTMDQVAYYIKEGTWPQKVIPRELYTWGLNNIGNLGLNDTINKSSPTQVGLLVDWSQVDVGRSHAAAIKKDNTLWTWGDNGSGALGQNIPQTTHKSSPVQVGALTVWSQTSAAYESTGAIKTDGTLWTWGLNNNGQLGQNLSTTVKKSSPVQVGADSDWYEISIDKYYYHVAAIKTNGTLWAWGFGPEGAIGQNDAISRSSPVQVGSLTTWAQASAGYGATLAIKTDGTLWAWGYGAIGQLGNSALGNVSSPIQVGALTNWAQVSAGFNAVLAVKTDGTLWAWGTGAEGKLGLGSTTDYSSPVQVGALTDWSQVSFGSSFGLATKTDGTIWSWGRNNEGQLGLNDPGDFNSPVQIGALTTWISPSAGNNFTAAITKG